MLEGHSSSKILMSLVHLASFHVGVLSICSNRLKTNNTGIIYYHLFPTWETKEIQQNINRFTCIQDMLLNAHYRRHENLGKECEWLKQKAMARQLVTHMMEKYHHSIDENMTYKKFSFLKKKHCQNNAPVFILPKVLTIMREGLWSLDTA